MAILKRLPTQTGLDFIKRWEGMREHPYLDSAGIPTIGYGTIRYEDGSAVTMDDPPIDAPRAEALLRDHVVRKACPSVLRLIAVPLSDPQYDALVSFTYNLGGGALQASTLRRKVNRGEHEAAAAEFPRWCHAGGQVVEGLRRRRRAEAEMYLSGVHELGQPEPAPPPAEAPPAEAPPAEAPPGAGSPATPPPQVAQGGDLPGGGRLGHV